MKYFNSGTLLYTNLELVFTESSHNALELLEKAQRAYISFILDNSSIARLMFGNKIDHNTEEFASLRIAARAAFGSLAKIVDVCQRQGVLKEGNTQQMALMIWATTHGLSLLYLDGRTHFILGQDAHIDFIAKLVFAHNYNALKS